jgi:hypothetical protein
LNQASVEGDPAIHRGEQAEGAFAPDIRGLDGRAVLQHGEQREHGTLRKIGVLENPAGLANHVTEFEHDRLKMRRDSREAGSLHRAEQSIALRSVAWLALGHNSFLQSTDETKCGAAATAVNRTASMVCRSTMSICIELTTFTVDGSRGLRNILVGRDVPEIAYASIGVHHEHFLHHRRHRRRPFRRRLFRAARLKKISGGVC